jgi:NADPH:quinone reductase-like Zn-dependent oxidoreductase
MKAAIRAQYGPPEALSVREVAKPTPKAHEILVRVHAATVNRTDCGILSGKPYIIRLFTGLRKPKLPSTGTDFAGQIEAAGDKVVDFQVGDRVWGFDDSGLGSHAQYLAIAENKAIAKIPAHIGYDEAAASAEGAHYAFNFLHKVRLEAGQKALVNGATGAIGSALLQFLKYRGLYVTAVGDTKNLERLRTLGADKTVDYTATDFTEDEERYHYVFDAVGKSAFRRCAPLLLKGGVYISSEVAPRAQNVSLPLLTRFSGDKKVIFPLPLDIKRSMRFILELLEQGKFRPLIDRKYPLENIREAFHYVAGGQKTGNVLLDLA